MTFQYSPKQVSISENSTLNILEISANKAIQGWGSALLTQGLSIVYASALPTGKVIYEYVVQGSHANGLGNLHGGCTATLFDYCTSTALIPISKPGFWMFLGVSRTLNVTYIRPIPIGEVVLIENEVVHAGKRMCKFSKPFPCKVLMNM
jgi:acyl-coenzyme A thioesterase 13